MPAQEPVAGSPAGAGARDMERAVAAATPNWLRLARTLLRIHDDERAWRVGAEGEERVGKTLSKLGEGWTVLHDLPLSTSGANLDHLVIGPGGVFALNTKNLSGKVWVGERMVMQNGTRTSFLPAGRREAEKTAALLGAATGRSGPVTPVLVIMCDELTVKQQPADVAVVTRRQLNRWLRKRPDELTPDTVDVLSAAARQVATWPTLAAPAV